MMYVSIPLGSAISDLPYGIGSLGDLIGNTVGFGIVIGAVFALIWLLLGGITWITSSGDKAKLEEARDRITQAIIGLAIVMSVWAIWTLVTSRFFGLNLSGGPGGGGGGSDSNVTSPSSSTGTCPRGISIGSCGIGPEGVKYRCLAPNTPCQKNPKGFPYPFYCPDPTCPTN